jgi:hypothetical protein
MTTTDNNALNRSGEATRVLINELIVAARLTLPFCETGRVIRAMNRLPVPSLLYAASSPEAGEARACWALARRTARYIKDGEILPDEELAYSRLDQSTVGVARFLCGPNGKLRDWAMISIDTAKLPRNVAALLDSLADAAAVHAGNQWRTGPRTQTRRRRTMPCTGGRHRAFTDGESTRRPR